MARSWNLRTKLWLVVAVVLALVLTYWVGGALLGSLFASLLSWATASVGIFLLLVLAIWWFNRKGGR